MRPDHSPRPDPPLLRLLASVRGRRLLFVASLAPGVILAVAGAQIWQSPALLALGVLWIGTAVAVRRISEARLRGRHPPLPSPSPRETAP